MLLPLIIASALFMESLDSNIIATSLPSIAHSLHQDPLALKLALTSYILALAIFIPLSGWVADRFGGCTVFRVAIAVFTIASVMCGFSDSLTHFVVWRFIQGMGASMMTPVGRLLVFRSVPKSDFIRSFSWLTIPPTIAPIVGPPLGGFITTFFEWRWIFWINVPIGILGIALATLYIPNTREESPGRLDWRGFALLAGGLFGLVFGITMAGNGILPLWETFGLIAVGLALLGLYVVYALHTDHPMLDLRLLRLKTFRSSIVGGIPFRIAAESTPLLLPLLLQIGLGMTPFAAGTLVLASGAGAFTMKVVAPRILKSFGFRQVLIINGAICVLTLLSPGVLFTQHTPVVVIAAVLLVGGFFRSLQWVSLTTIAFADVDNKRMSHATGLTYANQQICATLGIALGAALLERPGGSATLTVDDFRIAYMIMGALSAFSLLFFFKMPVDAAAHVSGRRIAKMAVADPAPQEEDRPRLAAE